MGRHTRDLPVCLQLVWGALGVSWDKKRHVRAAEEEGAPGTRRRCCVACSKLLSLSDRSIPATCTRVSRLCFFKTFLEGGSWSEGHQCATLTKVIKV